ncbi:VOC family protein [Natronomonas gomsonensis]|jgi:catechol 2,3-dioxygenase|uniref:VOC family protein n=1 Tax=Natronomonas gomsonensis TaxID=1046043 RepID=UPI0020CA4882|nr:VOC family protein [Natronomonas gomsonensis]MCY4732026.1 VOC family protein [Natronomonas gomsonensis]
MTHLGHIHLKVRDVERAVGFYTDCFDLAVEERVGRYAFLTFGEHHHDLALQGISDDAPDPLSGVGLYHAAFELDDEAALRTLYESLQERGVAVSPVDHGISKALYFDDPSGNGVEAYIDTRDDHGGEWAGVNERFDPTAL